MSAIFGIINKNGEPVDEEMIEKMRSSLLHRAVDGSRIVKAGNMMFGHHKLTVHRRQAQEKQPLQIDNLVITCDARIDNIEELFVELQLEKTTENFTDPFIILQAYKKWGNDCAKYLEGEFCFAIWDGNHKSFFGASDHIGFRSFYYYDNTEFLIFASEIKGIQSVKLESIEINRHIFSQYFIDFHQSATYDKKILYLLPASVIFFISNSILKVDKYWLASKRKGNLKNKSEKELYAFLLSIITKKIADQIDSDYPIGILLSGGLDSSLIASIACGLLKKENRKLHALCSVLPDNYQGNVKDESFYVKKLQEKFDNLVVHFISPPDELNPFSNLESIFHCLEEPPNTLYYVEAALFKKAKDLKIRTILSGFGGDETISYKGHYVIWHYLITGRISKAINLLIKKFKIEDDSLLRQIKREVLTNIPVYNKLSTIIHGKKKENIPLKVHIKKLINRGKTIESKSLFIKDVNNGDLGLMMKTWSKHASCYQVQFLCPFLMREIVDFVIDVPEYFFLKDGIRRSLIKNIMKNLVPNEIINRTDKQPFALDFEQKVNKIKYEDIEKYLRDYSLVADETGVNLKILKSLITDEPKPNDNEDGALFYIPAAIIAMEFYLHLTNISKEKQTCIKNY